MLKNLDEIKSLLQEHRTVLRKQFRVTALSIFGSYAKGQQTRESDVDILIEYEQAPTLWMIAELKDYLGNVLGLRVDIVTRNGLKKRIRERVLAEAVEI
ncbi:MAG: nucleotidyltransferase family protein [Spirulinaceae cyanobacterium]